MYHLHLTRNLRSLAFLLVAAALVTACGVLWWANRTGLPDSWRTVIEREISKKGVYVKIGRLSYLPLRGVIASKVRVFSDPAYRHDVSRLESVLLDFDKPKLARGIVDSGKGSHRKFEHDKLSASVVLSGKSGADAKHYQERLVKTRIRKANEA